MRSSVSASPPPRDALLKTLDETLRTVGAQSVLMSDGVAKLVGVNATDLECLDLVGLAGGTTAGRLATATGLTTGAMTAVIDRLERAGLARRVRDASDRRRVHVEVRAENARRIELLYRPLAAAVARLNEEYGDRQLAVIAEYLSRTVKLCAEHLVWLQKQPPLTRRTPARRYHRRRPGRARTSLVSTSLQKD